MTGDRHLDDRLVRAIHERRLDDEADALTGHHDPSSRDVGAAVLRTLERIASSVDVDGFAAALSSAGVRLIDIRRPDRAQRHEARFRIHRSQAMLALDVLESLGLHPHPAWRRGALRSYIRTSGHITATKTDRWTTVVRLDLEPLTRGPGRLGRVTTPRPADWAAVDLPDWAWRGYSVVRPVRLLLERAGVRHRDHGALEPFLATPTSVIGPLLDLAEVGAGDLVADLGCGDGRIIVEAVRQRGCRGLGIDHSAALIDAGRQRAIEHGVSERIEFSVGDATAVDPSAIDAVFLFLPMNIAAPMVDRLRRRLRPGARIVCHEQQPLPSGLTQPDRSVPIVSDDAVTVAHLWTVPDSREDEPTPPSLR